MGVLDYILGFFRTNFFPRTLIGEDLKDNTSDDLFCSAPAPKRFKTDHSSFGNSIFGTNYASNESMSPKQYFMSRRKVPVARALQPPVVQLNETDDEEEEVQVVSNGSELSKTPSLGNKSGISAPKSPSRETTDGGKYEPKEKDKSSLLPNVHSEDEIQVISSDTNAHIERTLPSSPCSSRAKIKHKPYVPEVYTVEDDESSNNKENEDEDVQVVESKPIARRFPADAFLPRWSTVACNIPRQRESSFFFKRKNPHERPSTLQQIHKIQSRQEYARLLQAISACTDNTSTRDNTLAPSSSRNSSSPTGSDITTLDRLSSPPHSMFSQSRPCSSQSRHISLNLGSGKRTYVDVVKAKPPTRAQKFSFLDHGPPPLSSRSKLPQTAPSSGDKIDAMIRRIQAIDFRRFDADIARTGLAVARTNEKVRSLEIPSYDVLLEKTINLRKVPIRLQPKKEEPKLPVIDEHMENMILSMKRGTKPGQVVVKIGLEEITKEQIMSLEGLTWLTDNVINCYMALLMQRSEQQAGKLPKVHGFNTFFHTALAEHGYARVRRWTKKVDLFSFDIIFVPVHVLKTHWCLATIDFRKKCVTYYDSMSGGDKGVCQRLLKYLADESMDKKKVPFDTSSWSTCVPKDIPQQENSSDCGVFTSTFAEYIARNADINQVTQANMPYYRKKMFLEIIRKNLLSFSN